MRKSASGYALGLVLAALGLRRLLDKAPVADLLDLGRDEGKPEIIGRGAFHGLIFEGARAIDLRRRVGLP